MKGRSMSGENSNDSGGVNPNVGDAGEKIPENKNIVSYETYTKVLDEAKAAKAKVKEYEDNFNRTKEEKLKADGDWKGLLESRESRIKELELANSEISTKHNSLSERITDSKKLSSILGKLEGNLDQKYYGLIDLNDVKINPETGEIDDMSASAVAERFKVEYPETIRKIFNPKSMGEGKNGTDNINGVISRDAWLKLSYQEQKKWPLKSIK